MTRTDFLRIARSAGTSEPMVRQTVIDMVAPLGGTDLVALTRRVTGCGSIWIGDRDRCIALLIEEALAA